MNKELFIEAIEAIKKQIQLDIEVSKHLGIKNRFNVFYALAISKLETKLKLIKKFIFKSLQI